jgi:hypothetical protein
MPDDRKKCRLPARQLAGHQGDGTACHGPLRQELTDGARVRSVASTRLVRTRPHRVFAVVWRTAGVIGSSAPNRRFAVVVAAVRGGRAAGAQVRVEGRADGDRQQVVGDQTARHGGLDPESHGATSVDRTLRPLSMHATTPRRFGQCGIRGRGASILVPTPLRAIRDSCYSRRQSVSPRFPGRRRGAGGRWPVRPP